MHVIGSMLLCDSIARLTQILFHLTVLTNTTCEQKSRISYEYLKGVITDEENVQIENIEVFFRPGA